MEELIEKIQILKEDKPELIITDDMIKYYILDNIEMLVKEIKEEL